MADTVARLRGRKKTDLEWETRVEMAPKGFIPPQYIESSRQRMALHQRVAKIRSTKEIDNLLEELTDIYGSPPREVLRLLLGVRLRVEAHNAGFETVSVGKRRGHLIYHASQVHRFNPTRVLQLDGKDGLKLTISTKGESIVIQVEDREREDVLAEKMLKLIAELRLPPTEEHTAEHQQQLEVKKKRPRYTGVTMAPVRH